MSNVIRREVKYKIYCVPISEIPLCYNNTDRGFKHRALEIAEQRE